MAIVSDLSRLFCVAATAAAALLALQAHAAPVSGQGTWETTLQGRELDGNVANGFEAYYDTALDITWLADANFAKTSGYTSLVNGGVSPGLVYDNAAKWTTGQMGWGAAKVWAATLNVNGITGWREPTLVDVGYDGCSRFTYSGSDTDCGFNTDTKLSEMAHLWYVTLGNTAFAPPNLWGTGLANTGPFVNLLGTYYWTDADVWLSPMNAWAFNLGSGIQIETPKERMQPAWAVHPGDVGAVPEPESYALLLAGLVTVLGVRGRQLR